MRRRILLCLGLLFVLSLTGYLVAIFCLGRSINQLSALAESLRIQAMRAGLVSSAVRVQTDLLSHLIGHTHTDEDRREHVQRFARSLKHCGSCHHPPHLKAEQDDIREVFNAYRTASERLYEDSEVDNQEELAREALELADHFVEGTTQLAQRAERHLVVTSGDVAASIDNAWVVLSVTLLVWSVVGGIVAFHLKARLTKPVEALLLGVERVSQGDLTYRMPVQTDKEFKVLAEAFNQAYQDIKKAQEEVIRAEKLAATGQLAAGVAHEVLNPLASISSIVQLMRRSDRSDEERERIDLIMGEIGRISQVLRDLLAFSRPANSEARGPMAIGPLLEHAATLIGYDHRAQKTQIIRHIDPGLHPVEGDSERLLLVFTNILLNALDAMSKCKNQPCKLEIIACNDGDNVQVTFQDHGEGMTAEQLERAFEPFFTTKEAGAGTGLGLWICYQVIQKHAGTIDIESRVGEGTTVIVELPGVIETTDGTA